LLRSQPPLPFPTLLQDTDVVLELLHPNARGACNGPHVTAHEPRRQHTAVHHHPGAAKAGTHLPAAAVAAVITVPIEVVVCAPDDDVAVERPIED
jgi:hypothetical protein